MHSGFRNNKSAMESMQNVDGKDEYNVNKQEVKKEKSWNPCIQIEGFLGLQ